MVTVVCHEPVPFRADAPPLFSALLRMGDALVLRRLLLDGSAREQCEAVPLLPWLVKLAEDCIASAVDVAAPPLSSAPIKALVGCA